RGSPVREVVVEEDGAALARDEAVANRDGPGVDVHVRGARRIADVRGQEEEAGRDALFPHRRLQPLEPLPPELREIDLGEIRNAQLRGADQLRVDTESAASTYVSPRYVLRTSSFWRSFFASSASAMCPVSST